MGKTKAENKAKKAQLMTKIFELFSKYDQICLVKFVHVGSNQIQQIRRILTNKKSQLVIAKNTLIKYIIKLKSQPLDPVKTPYYQKLKNMGNPKPELKILSDLMQEKVGLIFTNCAVFQLKSQIQKIQVATQARVGTISPIDLTIPPGPTGLDPSQISFFHALQISTKIVKAQIQISKDFKVCTIGKKVTQSQAALLKKLNLKPFFFGMKFLKCYDNGSILDEQVLGISPDDLLTSFENGVRNIIGASIQLGLPNKASVGSMISNAVLNLAALSLQSGFKVKGLQVSAGGPATSAPAGKKQEKKQQKKQVKKQEKKQQKKEQQQADYGFGDLF